MVESQHNLKPCALIFLLPTSQTLFLFLINAVLLNLWLCVKVRMLYNVCETPLECITLGTSSTWLKICKKKHNISFQEIIFFEFQI